MYNFREPSNYRIISSRLLYQGVIGGFCDLWVLCKIYNGLWTILCFRTWLNHSDPRIIRMTINGSFSCHNVNHIRNYGFNVCIMTLLDFFVLSFWCLCVGLLSAARELTSRAKKKLFQIDNVVLLVLLFFFMVVADCLFYFHAFVFSRKWHSCEIYIIIQINYIKSANSIIIFSTYLLQLVSFKTIRLVYHFIRVWILHISLGFYASYYTVKLHSVLAHKDTTNTQRHDKYSKTWQYSKAWQIIMISTLYSWSTNNLV